MIIFFQLDNKFIYKFIFRGSRYRRGWGEFLTFDLKKLVKKKKNKVLKINWFQLIHFCDASIVVLSPRHGFFIDLTATYKYVEPRKAKIIVITSLRIELDKIIFFQWW